MSVSSTNSITSYQSYELAQDIHNSTDPVEKNLSRLSSRILGFIIGGWAGLFLADAYIDSTKSGVIQSKLFRINSFKAQNATEESDLSIQKQVYTGIKNYTDNAQLIKMVTAIPGMIASCSWWHGMLTNNIRSIEIANIASNITLLGLGAAVLHRYTAGTQLQAENRALMERRV